MKLSAILLLPGAASFAPPAAGRLGRECPAELFQQPPARLTEADLMDKSRVNSLSALDGEDDDAPRLFSRSIYDDFQSSLLLLEKRLSDGPITAEEYGRLDAETGRIVREMNEYLADPAGCRERIERGYEAEAGAAVPEAKSPGVLDAGGAAVAAASKVAQGEMERGMCVRQSTRRSGTGRTPGLRLRGRGHGWAFKGGKMKCNRKQLAHRIDRSLSTSP